MLRASIWASRVSTVSAGSVVAGTGGSDVGAVSIGMAGNVGRLGSTARRSSIMACWNAAYNVLGSVFNSSSRRDGLRLEMKRLRAMWLNAEVAP